MGAGANGVFCCNLLKKRINEKAANRRIETYGKVPERALQELLPSIISLGQPTPDVDGSHRTILWFGADPGNSW